MKGLLALSLLSILLILFSLSFSSCTKNTQQESSVKVTLHFDAKNLLKKEAPLKYGKGTRATWGYASPASIGAYNCFAVLVSWSSSFTTNSCINSAGQNLSNPTVLMGTFPISTPSVSLTVPSGMARTFQVAAFYSASGTCPDFKTISVAQRQLLSAPAILGSTTVDLKQAEVNLNLTMSLSSRQEIAECTGGEFVWNAAAASASAVITNISHSNGKIVIDGTNLTSITALSLSGGSYQTTQTLAIESNTGTQMLVGGGSNVLSLLKNMTYDLLITDAIAATTYSISITGGTTNLSGSYNYSSITLSDSGKVYLITASIGSPTVTLPTAAIGDGFTISFKNMGTYAGFFATQSSQTIDDTNDALILLSKGFVTLISYNSNWYTAQDNGKITNRASVTCDGEGNSSSSSCYMNSTILNYKIAYDGSSYYSYDGQAWVRSDSKYLIRDVNSVISQKVSTSKNFAYIGATVVTGYSASKSIYYTGSIGYDSPSNLGYNVSANVAGLGVMNDTANYTTPSNNICFQKGMRLPLYSEFTAGNLTFRNFRDEKRYRDRSGPMRPFTITADISIDSCPSPGSYCYIDSNGGPNALTNSNDIRCVMDIASLSN